MLLARPKPFVVFGVLLMLLGALCLALPQIAAVSAALLVGVALLLGGLLALGHWRMTVGWPGSSASFFSGVVFLVIGLLVLMRPNAGIAAVGMLLGVFFLLDGAAKLMLGLSTRGIPGAGWNLLHGTVSLFLAIMLFAGWPTSATWVVGLVAGLHLLFKGWAMLVLGLSARALLASRA